MKEKMGWKNLKGKLGGEEIAVRGVEREKQQVRRKARREAGRGDNESGRGRQQKERPSW